MLPDGDSGDSLMDVGGCVVVIVVCLLTGNSHWHHHRQHWHLCVAVRIITAVASPWQPQPPPSSLTSPPAA
eukprot:11184822-Lingulodinium_polyedra.AAC.1